MKIYFAANFTQASFEKNICMLLNITYLKITAFNFYRCASKKYTSAFDIHVLSTTL